MARIDFRQRFLKSISWRGQAWNSIFASALRVAAVSIACAACGVSPGFAAPPPTTWTGFYIGGNGGYSWGSSDINFVEVPNLAGSGPFGGGICTKSLPTCVVPFALHPQSLLGGGQIGYNYQMGQWVLGVETDAQWRNDEQTTNFTFPFSDMMSLRDRQNWFGTLRGRVGFTPAFFGNSLFYVTGGLAYGGFDHGLTQVVVGQPPLSFSSSTTRAGWTVGAGVETPIAENLSIGAEYLYLDFGKDTLSGTTFYGDAFSTTFHDTAHVARVKLDYKFSP